MTEQDWWVRLEEEPDDPVRKLIFADWLEEEGGDPHLIQALRWCVRTRREPAYSKGIREWTWWWPGCGPQPPHCFLPISWGETDSDQIFLPFWPKKHQAIQALLDFARLKLGMGWVPNDEVDFIQGEE